MKQALISQGTKTNTVWLQDDKHRDVKKGNILSLKGLEGEWVVEEVYGVEIDEPNRTWKVGGL